MTATAPKAKFAVDVKVLNNLTVTPTFNVKNDTYIFAQNQEGLTSDRSYAAGIEAAYAATPDVTFLFSYMNERRSQNILSASNTYVCPYNAAAGACTPSYTAAQLTSTNVQDRVNTIILGVNYAVIPQKFDLHLGYTLSMGNNSQPLFFANGTGPQSGGFPSFIAGVANPGQFPDVNTTFQRVDATAKYVVDKDFVTSLGLKGEVAFKVRYAWERNSVANWNNDTMQPYMYSALMNQPQAAYVQWMAGEQSQLQRSPDRGCRHLRLVILHRANNTRSLLDGAPVRPTRRRRFDQRLIYVKVGFYPLGIRTSRWQIRLLGQHWVK